MALKSVHTYFERSTSLHEHRSVKITRCATGQIERHALQAYRVTPWGGRAQQFKGDSDIAGDSGLPSHQACAFVDVDTRNNSWIV